MRTPAKYLGVLLFVLLAAGCASMDPAKPVAVGNGVSVVPQIGWAEIKAADGMFWTADGVQLDQLHFFTGIHSGKPLFAASDAGRYDAKMLPNDVQDLMVATLEKAGYQNVRPARLRPCPFGAATGFCFDLSFLSADGLELKGRVAAAKRADQLDLLFFLAPSEYYFDALAPTVDRIFASIEVH